MSVSQPKQVSTVSIRSPSENTVYTRMVDKSSDYTDSSNMSLNLSNTRANFDDLRINEDENRHVNDIDTLLSESRSEIRQRIPPSAGMRGDCTFPGVAESSRGNDEVERRENQDHLDRIKADELIKEAERLKAEII